MRRRFVVSDNGREVGFVETRLPNWTATVQLLLPYIARNAGPAPLGTEDKPLATREVLSRKSTSFDNLGGC